MTISLDLKSANGDIVACRTLFTNIGALEEGAVSKASTDNDKE